MPTAAKNKCYVLLERQGALGAADMADVPIEATSTATHPSAFFPGRTAV